MMDAFTILIHKYNTSSLLEGVTIPNIGITYNNKIIEVQRQYEGKGLSFYDSFLLVVIVGYAFGKTVQGFEKLKELAPLIERGERFPFIVTKKARSQVEAVVEEYKKIDDSLYGFSIERDIGLAVAADMLVKLEDVENIYSGASIIEAYREELRRLGLSVNALDGFDGEEPCDREPQEKINIITPVDKPTEKR